MPVSWSAGLPIVLVTERLKVSLSPPTGLVKTTARFQLTPMVLGPPGASPDSVAELNQLSCAIVVGPVGVFVLMLTSIAVSVLGLTKLLFEDVLPHWTCVLLPCPVFTIWQF